MDSKLLCLAYTKHLFKESKINNWVALNIVHADKDLLRKETFLFTFPFLLICEHLILP